MKHKPKWIVGVDTEDDSKGNPTLFCYVDSEGSFVTENRVDFLVSLVSLQTRKSSLGFRVMVWCTNLEYDLVNIFGFENLSDVAFRFGRSVLISASWKGISFYDTLRHVPVSVSELGKLVSLEKLPMDIYSREYVARDAAITFRAAKFILGTYETFGVHSAGTLASAAYQIWYTNFWKREVILPWQEIIDFVQPAYYGGRVEPFYCGTYKNVHIIDVASMFPWAMISEPFPLPWGFAKRSRTIDPNGVYNVSVKISHPCIPYRSSHGLTFPIGSWTGNYIGSDLLLALRFGNNVKVHSGIAFRETCDPFTSYVETMFTLKNKSRGPLRLMYKLLLNSLYGKFGQSGETTKLMSLETFQKLPAGKAPLDFKIWNNLIIYCVTEKLPPWGNKIWSAIITSRARVKLAEEMSRIERSGCSVLYCDTDSIFYVGDNSISYAENAKQIGDFEYRGAFESVTICGKKEYSLFDGSKYEFKAKGIPQSKREQFLRTGNAQFERPIRIRESIARHLQPNIWTAHEKRRRVSLQNGKIPSVEITANGSL